MKNRVKIWLANKTRKMKAGATGLLFSLTKCFHESRNVKKAGKYDKIWENRDENWSENLQLCTEVSDEILD